MFCHTHHVPVCHDRPCPYCGHCPCCGRGGYGYWYPWRPWVVPTPPPPVYVQCGPRPGGKTQAINALAAGGGRVNR
jgi:hypothetical protein